MTKDNDGYIFSGSHELPGELKHTFEKATRLEWLTVAYLVSTILVMYFSMKSSQAMKAAWLEDILSMVPAISFLIASRFYNKQPNAEFPFGYHRVFSIAFQMGAFALLCMGLYIFYDSVMGLLKGEKPSIGSIQLFDRHWWMGFIMIGALVWSSIPSFFIGRNKLPLAQKLHNKILHTDAKTQKADWQTACAGIIGIIGVGYGLWWADSAAACFISLSVIKDGVTRTKDAVSDLIDQRPTSLKNDDPLPLHQKLMDELKKTNWIKDVHLRMREAGEIFFIEIFVIPQSFENYFDEIEGTLSKLKKLDWKIHDIVIIPVRSFDQAGNFMLHHKSDKEKSTA